MKIIRSSKQLRKLLNQMRQQGKTIGFVPTMGYFHEGHLKLMRTAKKDNDVCVVSLYVNPTQFAPSEDLSRYPRDIKRDSTMARKENVDILFIPSDNDMYSESYLTYVDVMGVSEGLCGEFRPGHFRGVATIVAKLLHLVLPAVMYLGQKDAQQVVVLKTMVRDLNFPVRIAVVPTVREKDGLAMSSRNKYLSPNERASAVVLYRALMQAKQMIASGERSTASLLKSITTMVNADPLAKLQYVACVDTDSLKPVQVIKREVLIALAVYIGKTRLIDNMTMRL